MLYELLKESKSNNQTLEEIMNLFEPKVKKTLFLTDYGEREDLAQELRYKLIKYIRGYNVDSTPGFWELKDQMKDRKNVLQNA
jgi:DNA-directed RNA polymerase specialized sigma24 family protein